MAVGVQVTMCTPIPPPWRITRDVIVVMGCSAARQVWRVAPSTNWVACSACANASSAAGMSVSASWW